MMEESASQEENPNADHNDEQDVEEIEGEEPPPLDDNDSDSEDKDKNDDEPSCRRNPQFQPRRSSRLHRAHPRWTGRNHVPNEWYYNDDMINFTDVSKDMFNLWKIEELRQKARSLWWSEMRSHSFLSKWEESSSQMNE